MTNHPQCCGIEQIFDDKTAQDDLKAYRRKGPSRNTRLLIEQVSKPGLGGKTLLDIGGGVGAIQLELLEAGLASATDVDASPAYLATAKKEAQRRGFLERISYHQGDFVDLAPSLEPADIVTLDRVICCYDDMHALVQGSSRLARETYAIIFPRDSWLFRAGARLANFLLHLFMRTSYSMFIHPTEEIERIVNQAGLKRTFTQRGLFWQLLIFSR